MTDIDLIASELCVRRQVRRLPRLVDNDEARTELRIVPLEDHPEPAPLMAMAATWQHRPGELGACEARSTHSGDERRDGLAPGAVLATRLRRLE
jgi:hypothetical protein